VSTSGGQNSRNGGEFDLSLISVSCRLRTARSPFSTPQPPLSLQNVGHDDCAHLLPTFPATLSPLRPLCRLSRLVSNCVHFVENHDDGFAYSEESQERWMRRVEWMRRRGRQRDGSRGGTSADHAFHFFLRLAGVVVPLVATGTARTSRESRSRLERERGSSGRESYARFWDWVVRGRRGSRLTWDYAAVTPSPDTTVESRTPRSGSSISCVPPLRASRTPS
jgi:hypothetical protein